MKKLGMKYCDGMSCASCNDYGSVVCLPKKGKSRDNYEERAARLAAVAAGLVLSLQELAGDLEDDLSQAPSHFIKTSYAARCVENALEALNRKIK